MLTVKQTGAAKPQDKSYRLAEAGQARFTLLQLRILQAPGPAYDTDR